MDRTPLKLKELSNMIAAQIKETGEEILSQLKIVSIIIGADESALSYLRGLKRQSEKLSIQFEIAEFDTDITESDFIKELDHFNNSPEYSGILIQMPLPKQIDYYNIATAINSAKDIDGIHPYNLGRLMAGKPFLVPATALAVDLTLAHIEKKFSYQLSGKNAVIVGRSLTVGKPAIHLLLNRNITTTTVHTRTQKTEEIARKADILVVSSGVSQMVDDSWVKKNAVVIDVGIHCLPANNDKGYLLRGDVNQPEVLKKAQIVTAVPGGIGPVTNTIIFANALKSWYKIHQNKEIDILQGLEKQEKTYGT